MTRACRGERAGTTPTEVMAGSRRFDIPYFAHQQLDPKHFPEAVGMAVGCPSDDAVLYDANGCANGTWDDSDNEFEGGAGDEFLPKAPKRKRRRSSANQIDASAYKRMKVTGGRPAIAKKVTAELDSDDDLLVRMKNAKYLEKDIARRLQDEGRISYNPKTIGTRWARLKKVLQKQQDELLDAELTDWHEGDDDVLYQAMQKADEEVRKTVEAAEARRWRIVSDQMKLLKPVVNFSHNACRNRHAALQTGSAKPTPESIQKPTQKTLESIRRRIEKEQKIQEDRESGAFGTFEAENIENNAWTSRKKTYY